MKKKKKTHSKTSTSRVSHHHHHHDDKSFLIIVGGGFLVILIALFLFGDQSKNLFSYVSESSELQVTPVVQQNMVVIENGAVNPEEITVMVGDTVTWQNTDSSSHTLEAVDGSFTTTPIPAGDSGSATFTTAGTYSYMSTENPNIAGLVVVEEAN